MNIQSNALKFTKDGGEVHIVVQYVKGSEKTNARLYGLSKDDSHGMREKKIIHDDDMINASAEADLDYVLNDRAAKYL